MLSVIIVLFLLFLFIKNTNDNKYDELVRSIGSQAVRWTIASRQDENAVIRALHNYYGLGYTYAIANNVSDYDFQRIIGINKQEFVKEMQREQHKTTKHLLNECPKHVFENIPRKYLELAREM